MSGRSSQVTPLKTSNPTPCVVCRLPLPIRPVSVAEVGRYWCCIRCGAKHLSVFMENSPAECKTNVRPHENDAAKPTPIVERRPTPAGSPTIGDPTGVATLPLPGRGPVVCSLQTQVSQSIDEAVARGEHLTGQSTGPPFINQLRNHGTRCYDAGTEAKLVEQYDESLRQLEALVTSLEQGDPVDPDAPRAIARESLVKATEDLDLFVRLGINPPSTGYPSRHSLHVAMLAASIGANLGWDENTLVELGVGCLLHDLGMLRIPDRLYDADRVLSDAEFNDVVRHPFYTFEALSEQLHRVPLVSRMVAYQTHERCDGSGYPRNRRSNLIHAAAKVAAVADVYVALVSNRPHRPALMPYAAIEHLLVGVKQGAFDVGAVRALLRTVSLFPIGSYLALKDGRVGRVMRTNRDQYARPIIEVWWPDQLENTPQVIDLSKASQIAIQGPLPRLLAS